MEKPEVIHIWGILRVFTDSLYFLNSVFQAWSLDKCIAGLLALPDQKQAHLWCVPASSRHRFFQSRNIGTLILCFIKNFILNFVHVHVRCPWRAREGPVSTGVGVNRQFWTRQCPFCKSNLGSLQEHVLIATVHLSLWPGTLTFFILECIYSFALSWPSFSSLADWYLPPTVSSCSGGIFFL